MISPSKFSVKIPDYQGEILTPVHSVIQFSQGLIGIKAPTIFQLTPILSDDENTLFWELTSLEEPVLKFVVLPLPCLGFDISQEDLSIELKNLNIEKDDTQLFSIVSIDSGHKNHPKISINLRAPLIVDKTTGQAWQIILNNNSYPIAMPLFSE